MTEIPALQPTVSQPTVKRSRVDEDLLEPARRRTPSNSQFDEIMPESKAQRLHHKKAREEWKWFDGVPCDRCSKEIPPLEPHSCEHGNYCSERCWLLAGGHMRQRFEDHYGVDF